MTRDELRAVAGQMIANCERLTAGGYRHHWLECCAAIARAYLAEHPADDAEPMTEEWVANSDLWLLYRPSPQSLPVYHRRAGTAAVYFHPRQRLIEIPGLDWRLSEPTRGHARQVIAALSLNSPSVS